MIHDVDDTLKQLLVSHVPIDLSEIDIRFEMPARDWSTNVSRPTVNLYLYDIRENLELRSNQPMRTAGADAFSLSPAPVRIDLCYLISVWTSDISDEHQLLGRVLTTLLRFPHLPEEVLRGSLQTQPFPVRGWIAQPERTPNAWDFWGHLEHRMKAGLSYCLTTSLEPHEAEDAPRVTEHRLTIRTPSRN